MVGEMEAKEKPKPTPDYLMQLMNDKKLMSSLPNFCGIFNHLERLLDEGEAPPGPAGPRPGPDARPPACGEGTVRPGRGRRGRAGVGRAGGTRRRGRRPRAAPRRLRGEPPAPPASRRACEHRDGRALRGPPGEEPGPAPRAPRAPEGHRARGRSGRGVSSRGDAGGAFALWEFV